MCIFPCWSCLSGWALAPIGKGPLDSPILSWPVCSSLCLRKSLGAHRDSHRPSPHLPTLWAQQWAECVLHEDSLRLTWRETWVKTTKKNIRAGGTEGIARGKERGRGPPWFSGLPSELERTVLLFEAQKDSISTQGWASPFSSFWARLEQRTSLGNFQEAGLTIGSW